MRLIPQIKILVHKGREKTVISKKNYVESTNYGDDVPQEQFLGLAIAGFIFSIIGLFILPIVFSVLGLIFGIIVVASNPPEDNEGFKPITK